MATIELSHADKGGTVDAAPGDELVLRLPENPTTGFRWDLDPLPGILELARDDFTPDPRIRVGSGGVREFRILVRTEGQGTIGLRHMQAWEGEASITERFSVDVRVSG